MKDAGVSRSVLDEIGDTPMHEVTRLDTGRCRLFLKLENQNPGGSIKDRIAPFIIEEAEKSGRLKPGGTIVEATSGNTGMGLAMAAIVKGYKCICVMSDKQSIDKVNMLKAMGVEVVVTPAEVGPHDPRSYYSVAQRLSERASSLSNVASRQGRQSHKALRTTLW